MFTISCTFPKFTISATSVILKMILLCCADVREERCFIMEIGEEENIYFLKKRVKKELGYRGPAMKLDLYLALKNDKWLDYESVVNGELTETIKELTQKDNRITRDGTIRTFFIGEKKPAIAEGQVHVLVVAPEDDAAGSVLGKREFLEAVESVMKKQKTDRTSWAISKLSMEKIDQLLFKIRRKRFPATDDLSMERDHPEFEWIDGKSESNREHVDLYKKYITTVLGNTTDLSIETGLTLDVSVGKPQLLLRGKADLCITPDGCLGRNEIVMVIELKSGCREETLSPANFAQTLGYFLAANTLFDCDDRPPPIGLLTNLKDAWCYFWVNAKKEISYAFKKKNGELLDRKTALYYLRKHCNYVNSCLQDEDVQSSNVSHATPDPHVVFGMIPAGRLEKYIVEYEDNMADVLETDEEIRLYEMSKRLRNTTAFVVPPPLMYS
ncbi:unnamed protein product [Aphanomyces euteiches]|nr:hypothetical protein AeRB84_020973 [Aphanomyces euteiches]